MGRRLRRAVVAVLACVVTLAAVAACSDGALTPEEPPRVVLLSPQHGGPRWVEHDLPALREQVTDDCEDCTVGHVRSTGDQGQDARRALREGADVLVLAAEDPGSAAAVVERAGEVPVVAVDRYVAGADYYVGPRPRQVAGRLLHAARADAGDGRVLVLAGPARDTETTALRQQARRGDDQRRVVLAAGTATGGPGPARDRVRRALDASEDPPLGAVVATTPAATTGAVRALAAAGPDAAERPAVVGRGASLTSVRRVVRGQQAAAVHTQAHHQAAYAAGVAATLLAGDEVADTTDLGGVPALLTDTRTATLASLTTAVVKDGTWTTREICGTTGVRQRCTQIGIR